MYKYYSNNYHKMIIQQDNLAWINVPDELYICQVASKI